MPRPILQQPPAAGIIWSEEDDDWKCSRCEGVGWCECLGGITDPLCDCGWPGYACHCQHNEVEDANCEL